MKDRNEQYEPSQLSEGKLEEQAQNVATIRYWILTTEYPPYHGGGIATYCIQLTRALSLQGVQVTVFVSDDSAEGQIESTEQFARVVRFNQKFVAGDHLIGRGALAYAFKEVVQDYIGRDGAPSVIEAQDYSGISYFILQERLCGSKIFDSFPIVIMGHTPEYIVNRANASIEYALPNFWNAEMERFCIKAADHVWSPSQNLARHLEEDVVARKTEVIRNPYFATEPAESLEDVDLLYFGRVQKLKGADACVAAFNNLCTKGLDKTLHIVGGDSSFEIQGRSMMEHLKHRYNNLIEDGLLKFHGILERHAALKFVERAKVVVIPSYYENFSYAALEAMSLGKVVVTSSQCGHSEIIRDGVNGYIFDHRIEGDLERKLHEAIILSDETRTQIGKNARSTVIKFCDPSTIARLKLDSIRRITLRSAGREAPQFPFIRVPARERNSGNTGVPGLLSIVIPYFNMGKFVEEALTSAIAAGYPDKEIVILNASSTEQKSIEVFHELKSKYSIHKNIKFLTIPDAGLSDTRNRGAQLANGEYLAFLDPDDVVIDSYYPQAIEILQRYCNVGFVGCWVQSFEGADNKWISWNTEPPYILFHNMINSAGCVYKRSIFLEVGGNDVNMRFGMEDYETIIRIVGSGYGGVSIPRLLFNYRVRRDSMMRTLAPATDIYNYERIAGKNLQIFEKYTADVIGLLNANGPGYRHDNPLVSPNIGAILKSDAEPESLPITEIARIINGTGAILTWEVVDWADVGTEFEEVVDFSGAEFELVVHVLDEPVSLRAAFVCKALGNQSDPEPPVLEIWRSFPVGMTYMKFDRKHLRTLRGEPNLGQVMGVFFGGSASAAKVSVVLNALLPNGDKVDLVRAHTSAG